MAAEPGPVGEQDPAGVLGVDGDLDRDRVGAVADVRRDRLGHLRAAGVVHVPVARLGQLGPLGGEDLDRVAILERQRLVLPACVHHRPISSCSFSGCWAARS